LTKECEYLLPIIRDLVKLNEHLNQEIALIQGIEKGTIRIGSYSSIAMHWMSKIIKKFQNQYPNIQIELIEEGSGDVLELLLLENNVDLSFLSIQPQHTCDRVELRNDPMLVVLPLGHPISALDAIHIS